MSATAADAADRRPMKGALFGATRLGVARPEAGAPPRHGTADATALDQPARSRPAALSPRRDRASVLIAARDTLAEASAAGADVGPAGAWLLDNFFVVLEQIPEIRATLPAGYYQELPKLAGDGPRAGYPRIYDIVVELIAHTDGRLDETSVSLHDRRVSARHDAHARRALGDSGHAAHGVSRERSPNGAARRARRRRSRLRRRVGVAPARRHAIGRRHERACRRSCTAGPT